MKRILLILLAFCFIAQPFYSMVLAQDEEEAGDSWGIVTQAGPSRIVLTEYDYDTGEETEVSYSIDTNTMLVNVDSVQEITIGDGAEIEFVSRGKDRIATVISVEKTEAEDMSLEDYGEEPEEGYNEEGDKTIGSMED